MTRLARAFSALDSEQRLAAAAALALVATMLLPWYSKTDTVLVGNAVKATQTSLSGFGALSFVEAAVLLVSLGVLALLFARGERRSFHMPGSDGAVVTLAGGWAALLIFFRLLDKPSLSGTQRITATVGLQWGIFFALVAACMLAYAGWRMRAASAPEPPVVRRGPRRRHPHDEEVTVLAPLAHRDVRSDPVPARPAQPAPSPPPSPSKGRIGGTPRRGRPRYPPSPSDQLSFDDAPDDQD